MKKSKNTGMNHSCLLNFSFTSMVFDAPPQLHKFSTSFDVIKEVSAYFYVPGFKSNSSSLKCEIKILLEPRKEKSIHEKS